MLIGRSDLHAVQLKLAKTLEGEKEGPRLTVGTVQYFHVIASISDSGIYHIRDHKIITIRPLLMLRLWSSRIKYNR